MFSTSAEVLFKRLVTLTEHVARAAAFVPGLEAFVRDVTASAERIRIPSDLTRDEAWVWWSNTDTVPVVIRFGSDGVVVSVTASGLANERIGATGQEPHLVVPAGATVARRLPPNATHFAHLAVGTPSGSGLLLFGRAEPPSPGGLR